MSDVVVHRLDRDAVVARLRAYAQRELAQRPEVRRAVLIGSLARGDWSARSDADVVVIVDRSELPFRMRSPDYQPRRSPGVAVDLLVYTEEERASWGPRFGAEVERGLVLFERESVSARG